MLEQQLKELTAALNALTAQLGKGGVYTSGIPGDVPPAAKAADKPKAETKPAATKAEPKAEAPKEEAPKATTPAAVDYDADIKAPFLKLYASDTKAALAVLTQFGVDTLKKATPDQYPAIAAALKTASVA